MHRRRYDLPSERSGVQFKLNGADLGIEDTAFPYAISWDTTSVTGGSYVLTATARDAAGNKTTSAGVTLTVIGGTAPPGPVAAYSFDEGSGTVALDSSGNNNTGTLVNNPAWTLGKYGKALSFNGSTSYVDLGSPGAFDTPGSMTWSAWVYAAADLPDEGFQTNEIWIHNRALKTICRNPIQRT